MKKIILSALIAIVAIGVAQSANATIFASDGTSIQCISGTPIDCVLFYPQYPGQTQVYCQNPVTNPGILPIGIIWDYSYDLAD